MTSSSSTLSCNQENILKNEPIMDIHKDKKELTLRDSIKQKL